MPKKPTRDQLATFLKTQELIKAFEGLFDLSSGDSGEIAALQLAVASLSARLTTAENELTESELNALMESARSGSIAQALGELAKAVDGLAMVPVSVPAGEVKAGAIRWNVRIITTSKTAAAGDWCDCDATGGAVTITPPSAASAIGRMITVCKSDASANQVIFDGPTNGAASASTTVRYTTMVFISNGTEWRLM